MLIVLALASLALIAHLVAHRRGAEFGRHVAAKILGAAVLAVIATLATQYVRRHCR
jgi:hypothetical protein